MGTGVAIILFRLDHRFFLQHRSEKVSISAFLPHDPRRSRFIPTPPAQHFLVLLRNFSPTPPDATKSPPDCSQWLSKRPCGLNDFGAFPTSRILNAQHPVWRILLLGMVVVVVVVVDASARVYAVMVYYNYCQHHMMALNRFFPPF